LKAGRPARILTVSAPSTSKIDFDSLDGTKENTQSYLSAFGSTKMMNIMFSYSLARRLEGSGVTSNIFHPGLVKSGLLKETPGFMYYMFRLISASPEKAAAMLAGLATDSRFEGSNGLFYKYNGDQIKSNEYSHDVDLQEKLWSISEGLTALPDSVRIESAHIETA
jgi:NAD(P)-dependent dehydrogenase (short-subunit alcohol dehydrogenase family)